MRNSSRSTQAVRLHKPFFLWSVPRGFTGLFREEMENSLLVMIQLLFEVSENFSLSLVHWSHTLHVSSSGLPFQRPLAPSLRTHWFWRRFLCLSQAVRSWDPVFSWATDTQHSAPLSPPYVVQRNWWSLIWCRKTEEKMNTNFQLCLFFPIGESRFPTHYTNLREFQDSSAHCFFFFLPYKLGWTCRHLFSLWDTTVLFLLSHSFREDHVKGEQNHLEISASKMQTLNPACSLVSQVYSCSQLSGPAHSELESHGNV